MTSETSRRPGGDDWLAEVERTLRGRDLADLVTTTRDGLTIQPLYTEGPARPAATAAATDPRRSDKGWDVRQHHRVAAAAGALDRLSPRIEEDLAGGATSLELDVAPGVGVDGLDRLLGGVDLAVTPLALAPHARPDTAEDLLALTARRGGRLAPGSSLGFDPLGERGRTGQDDDSCGPAARVARAGSSGRLGPGVMAYTVDAVRYIDAGATEAQALGAATATGVAYLRVLVSAGCSVDEAAGLVGFRLAATIAALRAARVMWSRVVTASGGSERAGRQYQHAVTATCTYSRRDPWVNLLRGASAALAAGVAGADAVTVLAFDHASGAVDADGVLGRRLARNTQLLLLEESHLARAADPAGGSFYVESLTEQLAAEGWRVFQDLEASGGVEAAISGGAMAAAVEQSWRSRLGALRTRSERLTGVSEFVLLDEPAPAAAAERVETPDGSALPVRRLSEPFEDLRDGADRHRMASGERPAAWVAALGPPSDRSTRTAWAQNMLAAGGIEVRGEGGVDSPIAAAANFAASGLAVAVIVGTDDHYRLRGAATAAALADSKAALVALVCDSGTPDELLDELERAGVEDFWHDGIDVVDALQRLHRILGIV